MGPQKQSQKPETDKNPWYQTGLNMWWSNAFMNRIKLHKSNVTLLLIVHFDYWWKNYRFITLKQNFKIHEWKRKRAKIIKTAFRGSHNTVLEPWCSKLPNSALLHSRVQKFIDQCRIIYQIRYCDWMQILIISSVASFASLNEMVPQENSTERGGERGGAVKREFPILTKTQPQMFTVQTPLASKFVLLDLLY